MTWFRVDDTLAAHHKVREAGLPAMGLWVLAGAHCSQQLTDGFVPQWWVSSHSRGTQYALSLVSCNLWRTVSNAEGDLIGYQFHDWEQANPSREQVLSERETAKNRQQAWRASRRDSAARHAVTNSVTNGVSHSAPTRPDPTPIKTPSVSSPRKRATSAPDIFPITDAMKEWGGLHCTNVHDPKAQTEQFLDHHRAKGSTFKDWTAAWRTWMNNAQRFAVRDGVKAPADYDPHKEHLRGTS